MMKAALLGLSILTLAGCSSEGSGTAPATGGTGGSGGGGTGGAAGDDGTGGTAATGGSSSGGSGGGTGGTGGGGTGGTGGGGNVPSWTGPASRSSDGVLTNHPNLQFATTGDLVITSAYLQILQTTSFNSVVAWGDVENRGSVMRCIPLLDLSISGVDIGGVVDGPAYKTSSSVTSACLPPGGKAAFRSIENEVSATLLDPPATVTYAISGLEPFSPAVPHPYEPAVLSAQIGTVTGGYGVTGEIQTTSNLIYNFAIHVYARDVSGLLFSDTDAYPGDLETLPVSSRMPFETYPVALGIVDNITGPFADFELYTSFIEGPAAYVIGGTESEWSVRVSAYNAQLTAFSAARQRLQQALP